LAADRANGFFQRGDPRPVGQKTIHLALSRLEAFFWPFQITGLAALDPLDK
jgi:hypothetical protein